MSKRIITAAIASFVFFACSVNPGEGVSYELAKQRKADIQDVSYRLNFNIPEYIDSYVIAEESICVTLKKRAAIVIDFKESDDKLHRISVNGSEIKAEVTDGHIVIGRKYTIKGDNIIDIDFTAGELSLNRRNKFLYTLLVPDRASTLFPCFDQPDIKGKYKLSLEIPAGWTAVSNTCVESESVVADGRTQVSFAQTEPLSTYLFSFVCGEFQKVSAERNSRSISIYHRETDDDKIAQCPAILNSIFNSIDYMEEYTAMPYPFAKYECIAIPDFQYGGMEHTGATLYNDKSLFLDANPTTAELQNRESLIAHETAHMWFGDCVTMKWFNDVWTKEVFANWFAARIVRPMFPDVNYAVSDMYNYYLSAYEEDRTPGSNAIQRPLDNLKNAGLIYCNIIYDKAPIVLEELNRKVGEDALKDGIRKYIHKYAYGNANWDDLIDILSGVADFNVSEWSRVWIKEKGMPEYDSNGNCIDPFGNGNIWQQEVTYKDVEKGLRLPNPDGKAYGCFRLNGQTAGHIYDNFQKFGDTERMSYAINLYENVWRGYIKEEDFQNWLCAALTSEDNPLIFETLLGFGQKLSHINPSCSDQMENALVKLTGNPDLNGENRLLAFRVLSKISRSESANQLLYDSWQRQSAPLDMKLGESDCTALAYQLALRYPQKAEYIHEVQCSRISNPDRRESFDYIFQAVSPDECVRNALFESFRNTEGRKPESRVLTALSLLCNPIRGDEATSRITPALELLPDVQKFGDIFFPASWCRRLLTAQTDYKAYCLVSDFLSGHQDMNPLLLTKIEQAAGWLLCHYGNKYEIIPKPAETVREYGKVSIDIKDIRHINNPEMPGESYLLNIDKSGVTIETGDYNGRLYAMQTLRQMIPESGISMAMDGNVTLPMCRIYDRPRYGYRSFMLDCSRHFVTVEEIKRVLDIMCFYKLNRFHWHLTDDQAWRIEIKRYPELTEGQSYYSQSEISEIVNYAADKGISVIPELELPGHIMAAMAAKPELGCTGGPYEMPDGWGVFEDVLCPGKESSFEFVENVIDEMTVLFPCEYFHIGGDECPKTRWMDCPECQARIAELGLTDGDGFYKEQRLQNYVTYRVQGYLQSKGRKIIGWEEILEGELSPDAIVMSWSGTEAGIKAGAKGNKVVMSPANFCYLDHCQINTDISDPSDATQEPESNEYFLALEWCHEYEPTTGFIDGTSDKIIGVEACLWTEYVEDAKKLEYMMLPRLAAISEVQWCAESERNYSEFYNALTNNHFPRYDSQEYMYCRVCQGINGYWK